MTAQTLTQDKQKRKEQPITRGVLDYFPHAIAEVAGLSHACNQQHNPGEPMHWSREKSTDHADCIARHLIERGTIDNDGQRHSAKVAWRALALLQTEIEAEASAQECPFEGKEDRKNYHLLKSYGCPDETAAQIVGGMTYSLVADAPMVYVAGPMRGFPKYNFPAFDAARDWLLERRFHVISPADIDRAAETTEHTPQDKLPPQHVFAFRDFWSLYFLARHGNPGNGIYLLHGWDKSRGASAEFAIANWLGLTIHF